MVGTGNDVAAVATHVVRPTDVVAEWARRHGLAGRATGAGPLTQEVPF